MLTARGMQCQMLSSDEVYLAEVVSFLWCSEEISVYDLHHQNQM